MTEELAIRPEKGSLEGRTESEVEQRIFELVALGDSERLIEGRAQAEAYAAYEMRAGAKANAARYARLKVLAEAGIGIIDLQEHPFHAGNGGGAAGGGKALKPLHIGETEIASHQRGIWRSLGVALKRGLLDDACGAVMAADGDVGTYSVWRAVSQAGAGYVPRDVLIKRLADVSRKELAKRSGLSEATVYSALRPQRDSPRIAYPRAEKLVLAAGVDPLALPSAPPKKHLRRKRRSRLRQEPKLRGGRWDKAYSMHRKTMQEIFAITGEASDQSNSGLWRNLHAVEDFLRRRI